MTIRFSRFAAVSTDSQATEDKASIDHQLASTLNAGLSKGWTDTSLAYIVPGESRTRWVNLRDAEHDIPPLHQMLEDGKRGAYDILILYDYNRLRDLLDPVAKTLASYGAQLYSVNQPVEPLTPEEFNPYASDSESIMRGMSQIISRWQISDLRRKYRYGVSARVRKGLYANRIPYGYSKPPGHEHDNKAVPVQVPTQARVVVAMKEMYLAGANYYDIKNYLKEKGIPSPQGAAEWSHTIIKKILTNPFYSGKVFFGRSRTVRDPNSNTMRVTRNPNPLIADGKHQSLYSWEDHIAILAEVERREDIGHNNRYPFSGLLVCSVCGATLHHDHGIWRCSPKDHVSMRVEEALALIPPLIQSAVGELVPTEISLPSKTSPDNAVNELERQRRRVQAAYESEIYGVEEAEAKIKSIDAQIRELKNGESSRLRRQAEHEQFVITLEQAKGLLSILPRWIAEDDPQKVNALLLRLCREIVVTPDAKITIHLRE